MWGRSILTVLFKKKKNKLAALAKWSATQHMLISNLNFPLPSQQPVSQSAIEFEPELSFDWLKGDN